jgi:transketolase
VINALAKTLPSLMGGSADLGPSNNTAIEGSTSFGPDDRTGRNLHFGVREHAMGAIASGMSLHGGVIPYTGTFLTFSDYMRPAIRLACLMGIRAIYVFTHDSIGLGEDGPTHQPIEHLAALRAIPGLTVFRPGDAAETAEAWRMAVEKRDGPTAILLTRQKVPTLDRTVYAGAAGTRFGGYVLRDPEGSPELILLGTGSELGLVVEAEVELRRLGVAARVVSLPSWEVFGRQDARYRDQVLPPSVPKRLAVEAGIPMGWERFVGAQGAMMGVTTFGESAPYQDVYAHFGLTVDAVVSRALALLEKEAS